jgi:hypothetical protein
MNFIRLKEARLQALSSRNMYSLQGLEALMRPLDLQVCHSLMVVSNCMPGSPHAQALWAISFIRSRALYSSITSPLVMARVCQMRSSSTARMKLSGTRTEWLAFWKKTEL